MLPHGIGSQAVFGGEFGSRPRAAFKRLDDSSARGLEKTSFSHGFKGIIV
jgi:hypothetical protein